jgi:hypothetical protein
MAIGVKSLKFSGICAALALSMGCGGESPGSGQTGGGKERVCPGGTGNAGSTIMTVNCSTVVKYDGNEVEASLNVKSLGGAGFKNVPQVLREVDQAATESQVQFTQVCEMYNSCQLTSAEYRARLDAAQAHFRKLRERVSLLQASDGNPEVLRQTMQTLYFETVPPEKVAQSTLGMEMSVQAKQGAAPARTIADGEVLRTGDQVVFGVRVSQPAHVYVFQKKQSGALDVLFPNSAISNLQNPLPAGQLVRIPPGGQVFTLDDQDLGREQVYIAVSRSPLTQLDSALRAAGAGASNGVDQVGQAMGDLFNEAAPECQEQTRGLTVQSESGCGSMTRGLTPQKSSGDDFFGGQSTVAARSNPGDDVILRTFSFIHQ